MILLLSLYVLLLYGQIQQLFLLPRPQGLIATKASAHLTSEESPSLIFPDFFG